MRGTPAETRARLIAAAAEVFNRDGYHGTDSNRIARAAGYAPGTFYKHFTDKREILLAAYEEWVTAEWSAIEAEIRAGGGAEAIARRIVDLVLAQHRRWARLRSSVLALVAADREVRAFYLGQRRRQLKMLRDLRAGLRARERTSAEDAVLLFMLERSCDAIANSELTDLDLSASSVVAVLRDAVHRHLERPQPRARPD